MIYRELNLLDLSIENAEIYLSMGYRNHIPDEYIRSMITDVRKEIETICNPRLMYRIVDAGLTESCRLKIGSQSFSVGGIIKSYLPGMTQACLFIATAGKEYDAYLHKLRSEGDIVKEFVADAIGSVIAEACVGEISKKLDLFPDFNHSLPYSPGYCGWNICEQGKLFSFFPDLPCGITLTESFLMSPVKSVSGFFGLGKEIQPQPYRCEICRNKNCFKRKEQDYVEHEKMGC